MTGLRQHFTAPNGAEQRSREIATPRGAAYFTGTGPKGATCRECRFWGNAPKFRRDKEGFLKPRECQKFRAFNGGQNGPAIRHSTEACKYFESRDDAPAARKVKGERRPRRKKQKIAAALKPRKTGAENG
jgi:hypothetical protein